jgi:hypothetical protein
MNVINRIYTSCQKIVESLPAGPAVLISSILAPPKTHNLVIIVATKIQPMITILSTHGVRLMHLRLDIVMAMKRVLRIVATLATHAHQIHTIIEPHRHTSILPRAALTKIHVLKLAGSVLVVLHPHVQVRLHLH